MPLLSIVIVGSNTKDDLERCLSSIMRHFHGISFELIVVDNASSDGSASMVTANFPEAILLERREPAGYGSNCNFGAAKAKGKFLLFLNSDIVFLDSPKDWVAFLASNLKIGVSGIKLVNQKGEPQPYICGKKHSLFSATFGKVFPFKVRPWDGKVPCSVDWVTGACLLIRRGVFKRLGGFDEHFFMYFEDEDLCLRAKKLGSEVWYYPDFYVRHTGGASLKRSKDRLDYYFSSQDYFYGKHHRLLQKLLLRLLRWPWRLIFRRS